MEPHFLRLSLRGDIWILWILLVYERTYTVATALSFISRVGLSDQVRVLWLSIDGVKIPIRGHCTLYDEGVCLYLAVH